MTTPGRYVRGNIEACAHCGQSDAPYAYLQDGQHYCIRCARKMLITAKLRPAGRRTDDLTVDDVLFRDLPYSPDPAVEDAPDSSGSASSPQSPAAGDR